MSAFAEAQKLYDGCDLQQIMSYCAHNGVVYADNELFLCAYPTCRASLIETQSKKELDKADTWYVYIASGNLKKAFEVIRPLKYVAYRRMDDRFRVIEFDKMQRRF
jgi:hypothetical protein